MQPHAVTTAPKPGFTDRGLLAASALAPALRLRVLGAMMMRAGYAARLHQIEEGRS